MNQEQKNKYERLAKITGIVIGLVLVLGISYAVFKTTTLSDKTNEISAGKLELRIDHEEDEILLENAVPITEEEGLKQSPYVFDVVNEGTINAAYDLYIEVDEEISTLPTSVVRYYLTVEEDNEEKIVTSRSRIIGQEEVVEKEGKKLYKIDRKYIDTNKTNKYKLYLWIDNEATVEKAANKYFEARVAIEGEQIYDKNRLVKQIDVSELGDNSVIAYMYADGRVVIKGKGTIASNLSDTLGYEKEGVLENWKKTLLAMGCNEEEVKRLTTKEEVDAYTSNFSYEDWNNFNVVLYKDVLEEMGYDTSGITDIDTLMQYMIEQGLIDEEGNLTEKGEELELRANEEYNDKYDFSPKAPSKIELEEGITNIPEGLFTGNEDITEVVIPNSVTEIGPSAFSYCTGLTELEIPNGVTSIGDAAFYHCTSLIEINIPNSVTEIGSSAFYHCTSLIEINIPNSVTEIGPSAFSGCSSLTNIKLPNNLTKIENSVFSNCTSLTLIDLPNSVTEIGPYAFSYCTGLTELEIPNGVTEIGSSAFSGCSSLTNIKLPNNLTKIEDSVFSNCTSLTSIDLPNSVTSMGHEVFSNCSSLTSIEIPSSVTSIGRNAFTGCNSIKKLTIDGTKNYGNLNISNIEELVITGEGNMYNYYDNNRPWYSSRENIKKVVISDEITTIGKNAFTGCNGIKKLTINGTKVYGDLGISNIEELVITGEGDMYDYYAGGRPWHSSSENIKKVTIGDKFTSIGSYAFYECTSLKAIEIPNSVTNIEYYAFSNCTSLNSIEIPSSVTNIGSGAFSGCSSLTNIMIPNSVTSGGYWIFSGWTENQTINIDNTEAFVNNNWESMWKDESSAQINYLRS